MDAFDSVSSLFEEFEKDRTSSGLFISYNKTDEGQEDRSRIIFRTEASESDSSSDEIDDIENESRTQDENETSTQDEEEENSFVLPSASEKESEYDEQNATGGFNSKNASHFKLVHERIKFQKFANLIDSTRFVPDEESPGCQVIFQNNRFSRKYRLQIEQFIYTLMKRDEKDPERIADLNLKPSVPTCVDINTKLPSTHRTSDMWNAHAIIGCSQFHREFIVDSLGWPLVGNNPCLTEGWHCPKYEQAFYDALPADEQDQSEVRRQRPKASCFNCGGEHMISECSQPKDWRQISINKKKFLESQPAKPTLQKQGSSRYHVDDEVDPRFAKFRPGIISKELRTALGLSSKKLPPYIYKMREHGYPPGWLEEAKVSTSGIVMFDKHGKEVNLDGDSMEDGEVDALPNNGEIDAERIIEYPGFTSEIPEGVIDESAELGFPPVQSHQLKSTLKAQMEATTELKKRKSNAAEDPRVKKLRTESEDMDISVGEEDEMNTSVSNGSFRPPLPVDTPPSQPPLPDGTPPPTPEGLRRRITLGRQVSEASTTGSTRSSSPTLEELEKEYQMLQKGLKETEEGSDIELQVLDSVSGSDVEDESSDTQELLDLKRRIVRSGSTTSIQTFGELGTGSPAGSAPGTPLPIPGGSSIASPLTFHKSVSIGKDFGTPILQSEVSVKSLPDSSKFGVGIEDHIPYENLPDATGTFNKMRGLLQKIRQKVSLRKKKS